MPELLVGVALEYLALDDYVEDFYRVSADLDGPIWKSERAQAFAEPGNPSWEAFARGRWAEALTLAGAGSTELKAYFAELDSRGCPFYRVRVTELPPTPYLQWEMHAIRARAQAGAGRAGLGTRTVLPGPQRDGLLIRLVWFGCGVAVARWVGRRLIRRGR